VVVLVPLNQPDIGISIYQSTEGRCEVMVSGGMVVPIQRIMPQYAAAGKTVKRSQWPTFQVVRPNWTIIDRTILPTPFSA
jgi:hypothetical protein